LAQIVFEGADAEADEQREHDDVERQEDVKVRRERSHPVASVERRDDQREAGDRGGLRGDAATLTSTDE